MQEGRWEPGHLVTWTNGLWRWTRRYCREEGGGRGGGVSDLFRDELKGRGRGRRWGEGGDVPDLFRDELRGCGTGRGWGGRGGGRARPDPHLRGGGGGEGGHGLTPT